jgi:predicted permease
MNPALQKTLTFVLLILAGYFLQRKITGKQELKGVKAMILSVILPATIFVALLRVEIAPSMLLLPLAALGLNAALYGISRWVVPRLGFEGGSPQERTMLLLVPSLAPGLSCFPFILEYLGEESLALAALADVGNKVFVLIILYLVAMHWFYRSRHGTEQISRGSKLKELGLSLLREPVNLVILLAIGMLGLGYTVDSLPVFLGDTVARLAALMTPIVLLFIGMAVRFQRQEMALILRTLCYRSGLAFLLSAMLVYTAGLTGAMALLAVIFAQCAVSFWPYAHMAAAEAMRESGSDRVFDLDLGLNVLAFSLPFSTVVILTVLSFGDWFSHPLTILPAAGLLLLGPGIYIVRGYLPAGELGDARA